jgi:hypothetical protein
VVWYDLSLANKYKVKYTPIKVEETEYQDVDFDGTPLKKVSGTFTKGYFINEKTGQRIDKPYKLINGQVTSGWTGRIKEVDDNQIFYVDENEADDLIVEHTYLIESERLYNDLKNNKQAIIFAGWFGNGTKLYKCYITYSKLYDGYCMMKAGRGQLSEQISKVVSELTEIRELRKQLEQLELNKKKVNNINPMDILKIKPK